MRAFCSDRLDCLKRVPKASRNNLARAFITVFDKICSQPDLLSHWCSLFTLIGKCLSATKKDNNNSQSLAPKVNERIPAFQSSEEAPATRDQKKARKPKPSTQSPSEELSKRVSAKIEASDIKGAIRVASSDEEMVDPSDPAVVDELRKKHPPRSNAVSSIPVPSSESPVVCRVSSVSEAIQSFASGSAAGPNRVTPQILKDLISQRGEASQPFLSSLTSFINIVLAGKVPALIRPFVFGVNLFAMSKKTGGVRPIAVGKVFRRLASKCGGRAYSTARKDSYGARQLGYGTPRGAEAAVHATRMYIHDNIERSGKVILKIDFKNAFNSISRNKFLSLIHERYPGLYPYTHAAYDSASHLFIGDSALSSDEGGQQGDPEAPPIFCDTVNEITHKVESELNLWYLDDGNLGGDYAIVLRDFRMIISESAKLGLEVRPTKCELYFLGNSSETQKSLILSEFNKISPLIETPGIDNLIILGAPVGNLTISNVLSDQIADLERMCLRLKNIEAHHAFFLLKSSFSIPKLLYILRSSPCLNYPELLAKYDDILYSSLESICNIRLDIDARKQASLPAALGGLGLGSASVLAICGYLSSVGSSSRLCSEILNKPLTLCMKEPCHNGMSSLAPPLSPRTTFRSLGLTPYTEPGLII